jgi:hypothetical protein
MDPERKGVFGESIERERAGEGEKGNLEFRGPERDADEEWSFVGSRDG